MCAALVERASRALLHDDKKDDKKGGGGGGGGGGSCECKHADWYSYGYCNIGTTSGDVKGCQQAYLVCCGWGKVRLRPLSLAVQRRLAHKLLAAALCLALLLDHEESRLEHRKPHPMHGDELDSAV